MPSRPLSSSGMSPSSFSLSHWASAHPWLGLHVGPWPSDPLGMASHGQQTYPCRLSERCAPVCLCRAGHTGQRRSPAAHGRCRGSAPGPWHRTPGHRADTPPQRRGGGGGDSATSGIPGTRTTNGIVKTQVKDVLPAMQPLDSTLWWPMLARSLGRGDQTDRRAQRSAVWCPRPRAARRRSWSVHTNHGSRPAGEPRGTGATGSEGPTRKERTWPPGLGLPPGPERRFLRA